MTPNKSFFLAILSMLLLALSGSAADPANEAPQIRLIKPQDGQIFMGPTNVRLLAYAQDREDSFAFSLEISEDLSTWVPLCTNVVTDGALRFVDPEALQHSHRFYRIVPQSNYVPEE